MEKVLHGLPVKRYVDDIVVATDTWDEHLDLLKKVLERCREHGVKIKASKCNIGKAEVEVLGHIVGRAGIRPNPEKVKAIVSMPAPKTAAEVRTFLGCVSFYRRYCKDLSQCVLGMRQLLKKRAKWNWTDELQGEFDEAKRLLMSEDIMLQHPDISRPFYIHVDASKKGIGAVLMQEVSGQEGEGKEDGEKHLRVVEYYSTLLKDGEKNYGITDLEGLGVVKAIERWHPYVYGGDLTVVTDHRPLLSMAKSNNARQIRWMLRLAPYSFKIRWKAGKDHGGPDCLSRLLPEEEHAAKNGARGGRAQ
jgi:hypothetical protein